MDYLGARHWLATVFGRHSARYHLSRCAHPSVLRARSASVRLHPRYDGLIKRVICFVGPNLIYAYRKSILRRNERVFRHQRVWTDRGVNWSFARYEYAILILLVCPTYITPNICTAGILVTTMDIYKSFYASRASQKLDDNSKQRIAHLHKVSTEVKRIQQIDERLHLAQ